jgi:anti-sigma factor RsiW
MNPCSKTSLLTAYLLGELSEPDAVEMAAHLATCAECGKTAAELRATVELLRETLAPAEETEMRLDDARRRALLEVRPQK